MVQADLAGAEAPRFAAWRQNPVSFVREVFGAEPDVWQAQGLTAFASEKRLAFQACKGPGKSCFAAWAIWWFLLTQEDPKIVCVSITADNLRDNLWSEIALWAARAPLTQKLFKISATRIESIESPKTWWCSARSYAKDANPEQQADTLAGLHGENVLVVLDEAGGIPVSVLEAADAIFANPGGCKRLVMLGNPTDLSGSLHHAVTRDRARWWVKEITGDPDAPDRSPRIDIETARQKIALYGRDHPWVRVNILGKFPGKAANTLCGIDEVTAAMERGRKPMEAPPDAQEPLIFGVDVARFGDDRSVLFARRGADAASIPPMEWRATDNMELAAEIAEAIRQHKPARVFIDSGGGAGVIDRLRQLELEGIVEVNFGGEAMKHADCPAFANKRSEMWWLMASWLKTPDCRLPDVSSLVPELTTPKYAFNSHNAVALERKDDIKKRLGASPDYADALALTFAEPVTAEDADFWTPRRGRW